VAYEPATYFDFLASMLYNSILIGGRQIFFREDTGKMSYNLSISLLHYSSDSNSQKEEKSTELHECIFSKGGSHEKVSYFTDDARVFNSGR